MLVSDKDLMNFIRSSEEGLYKASVFIALGISWLAHVPWLGRFLAPSPKDPGGFGKILATCFSYVDQRAADPTDERSDMLASFIRHGIVGDELRTEAVEQVLAGSDTTSSAISGIFLHLMTNPRVKRRLQREFDEAVQSGESHLSATGIIPHERAKKLPYLQAVIREGVRTWPPVVNPFSKDVPPGGDTVTVDGKSVFIPGGTCVGYSATAMHHDKELYGDDAQSFRPERWFEKDPEKLAAMTRTNDLMFGYGKWQCLGKPVAMIELNKIIFEVRISCTYSKSNV
jgi:cytochrome P450